MQGAVSTAAEAAAVPATLQGILHPCPTASARNFAPASALPGRQHAHCPIPPSPLIFVWGCLQGAFSIAAKAGVPVVPVTLVGTGRLMPNGQESRLFGGCARVIVHPRIPPSKDADAMAAAAHAVIIESLPPEQR